jgi:large subunit ribosomal protein L4e
VKREIRENISHTMSAPTTTVKAPTVASSTKQPLVAVYSAATGKPLPGSSLRLPAVFRAPVRDDVVRFVHRDMNKNRRQAIGVMEMAGHQTSAESWGTGRAVARIPRVAGGGTHRSGQGAFGNMCRGGHMFAPNKTWRRWHRRININAKRYALASAVAASGIAPLVLARGHRVAHIPEIPLVVSAESIAQIAKTKDAVVALKKLGAYGDVARVAESHKIRAGKGKMRNRRYTQRVGPLIVYKTKANICRAFRNIPGVDLCCVSRLNLLKLAPGGHLGRFVIWTSDAFEELKSVFSSARKHGFHLARPKLSNASISRVIRSEEVKAVLRRAKHTKRLMRHKNPLVNFGQMVKLNPHAAVSRREIILASKAAEQRRLRKAALLKHKAEGKKPARKVAKTAKKAAEPKKAAASKKPKKASTYKHKPVVSKRHADKVHNHAIKKARKAFTPILFA